jgi:hypothetical protein
VALRTVLERAVGFRACHAVLGSLGEYLPQFRATPAPNTVESWVLRLGLHELRRPKERADDWVFLVDHTLQLGTLKCLLIVGIRQQAWEKRAAPLTHQDLTVLALEPVEKSDGARVEQQLEAVAAQVGVPLAILNDEGADIVNGVARFQEKHPQTQALNDVAHKTAVFLKRELLADRRWESFIKECGQTQPKVKQTELGHLAPPTQKVKARYMNLGPLMNWGAKMQRLLDNPQPELLGKVSTARLHEKFGWLTDFREALVDWNDLDSVRESTLAYARIEGYHAGAARGLSQRLRLVARTAVGERLAEALVAFVKEQSCGVRRGTSLPASSEVLESLIGKGKRLEGQHSRGGFTKLILGMPASVVRLTQDGICQALQAVRNLDLTAWCQERLGVSLTAQRRRALPALAGTKVG